MKGYIARRNASFKMTDVIQLTHDAIAAVTEDDWVSSCRHVEKVERKYWDADIAVEAEMEKIVIKNTIVKHLKYNKNMIKVFLSNNDI